LSVFTDGSLLQVGLTGADYLVLAMGLIVVLGVSILKVRIGSVRDALAKKPAICFYGIMGLLVVIITVFGAYGIGYDASQFIYNQF